MNSTQFIQLQHPKATEYFIRIWHLLSNKCNTKFNLKQILIIMFKSMPCTFSNCHKISPQLNPNQGRTYSAIFSKFIFMLFGKFIPMVVTTSFWKEFFDVTISDQSIKCYLIVTVSILKSSQKICLTLVNRFIMWYFLWVPLSTVCIK